MAEKRYFNVCIGNSRNILREAHTAKDVLNAYGVILADGERAKAGKVYTARTGESVSYVPVSKAVYDAHFAALEVAKEVTPMERGKVDGKEAAKVGREIAHRYALQQLASEGSNAATAEKDYWRAYAEETKGKKKPRKLRRILRRAQQQRRLCAV